MLERFDEAAERVVAFAQDEARAMGHWYVGTEHLLLGLVADEGPAGRAFRARGRRSRPRSRPATISRPARSRSARGRAARSKGRRARRWASRTTSSAPS